MPTSTDVAMTPYYLLMEGNHRIGPKVAPLHSGIECSPIYGFSDKNAYDKFCMNSQLTLRPYPLVKSFLRDEANVQGECLKLVVVGATGPSAPYLHAASIAAVLEAHENRKTHVTLEYRLMLDQVANSYQVEEASV